MKKRKKYIVSLVALLALAITLISPKVVFAQELKEMSAPIVVSKTGAYTFSNLDNFGYFSANNNSNKSTADELIHHSSNSSVSAAIRQNGEFFANVKLTDALTQAGKNGYLTFDLSASMHTLNKKVLFDGPELLKMTARQGTADNDLRGSFKDIDSNSTLSVETRQLNYTEMAINNAQVKANIIRVQFTSEAENLAYINTMYVKAPKISFNSQDVTSPLIEKIETDKTGWSNHSRKVLIFVNDSESGIDEVVVNGEKAIVESLTSDTKSGVFSFLATENINYNITVKDNVGNKISSVYTEKGLDFVLPIAPKVDVSDSWYFTKQINFNLSNQVESSEVRYFYTLDKTLPTNKSTELKLGQNTINLKENGVYTLKILAIDEAGNSVIVEKVLRVDDTIYNVSFKTNQLDILMPSNKQFNRGQLLEFDITMPNGYIFSKLNCNNIDLGATLQNNLLQVSMEVDKNLEFELVAQKIVEAQLKKNYLFNGASQSLEFTLNDENARNYINMVITQQGTPVELINAGEYNVTLDINTQDYFMHIVDTVTLERLRLKIELESYMSVYNGTAEQLLIKNKMENINYNFTILLGKEVVAEIKDSGIYNLKIVVDENNYFGEGNFSYEVRKRQLNIYADNAQSKYGEDLAKMTFTYSNLVVGDKITGSLTKELGYNVGDYLISRGDLDAKNYDIVFKGAVYTIIPRELTITFEGNFKTYGESDPEINYAISGDKILLNDKIEISVGRSLGEGVGNYKYCVFDIGNSNYHITTVDAKLRIVPKKIMIALQNDYSKIYGDNDPFFEYKLINGKPLGNDNLGIVIVRDSGENVGLYNLKVESGNANYQVFMADNTFEILKKEITVTVSENSKIYGEQDKDIVYQVADLCEGDILEGKLSRKIGENVGAYEVTLGTLENRNYYINFITDNFYINKRDITVTPLLEQGKVYGEKDANINFTVENILESDALDGALSRAQGEQIGQYIIEQGSLKNENYNINILETYFSITKRTAYVNALESSKQFGEQDIDIKFEIRNVVNDDVFEGKLARTAGENVGEYEINLGTLNNLNYQIEFKSNLFSITKAKINLALISKTEVFNNKVMEIDEIAGLPFIVKYIYTLNGEETQPFNVGAYEVRAVFEGDENYEAVESDIATLTILPKEVYVTVITSEAIHNGLEQFPVLNLSIDLPFFINFEVAPLEIGSYGYTINIDDANYICNFSGTYAIIEAPSFGEDNRVEANHPLDKDEVLSLNIVETPKELNIIRSDINKSFADRQLVRACRLSTNGDVTQGLCKITLKIDNLKDFKDLKVYAKYGKDFMELSYEVKGEEISFNIEDYNFDYVVTAEATNFFEDNIVAIGGGSSLVIGSVLFFERKKIFKKKPNKD